MPKNRVNMTLSTLAMNNATDLTKRLNLRSRTAAIESSLNLTELLVERLQKGGKLQVVGKNGEVETIVVPGLSHG